MPDPFGDADHAAIGLFDDHANARRARTAMGTAIDVGYQTGHGYSLTMRHGDLRRQDDSFDALRHTLWLHRILWKTLWTTRTPTSHVIRNRFLQALHEADNSLIFSRFAPIFGVDFFRSFNRM